MLIAILFSFNLHAISHINDDDHNEDEAACELCLVTTNEDKEFVGITPSGIDFTTTKNLLFQYNTPQYSVRQSAVSKKLYKSDCFNKPPPVSIS